MRIPESELIINDDGSVFHLHLKPEDIADNIILVGDPGRVDMTADLLTDIEFRKESREFVAITGKAGGERVTVLSTGIGTDNIDIVMTELDALANIDFKTREVKAKHRTLKILRVGTCGAVQPDIPVGSFIFSHISVGCDGMLNWYRDIEKVSLPDMEKSFIEQTDYNDRLARPYFVRASQKLIDVFKDATVKGVTISACGFYGPQGRVLRLGLAMPEMLDKFEKFRYGDYRITNFEMESSAVAGMAAHLGHEAGTVCCAIANRHIQSSNPNYKSDVKRLLALALERLPKA